MGGVFRKYWHRAFQRRKYTPAAKFPVVTTTPATLTATGALPAPIVAFTKSQSTLSVAAALLQPTVIKVNNTWIRGGFGRRILTPSRRNPMPSAAPTIQPASRSYGR